MHTDDLLILLRYQKAMSQKFLLLTDWRPSSGECRKISLSFVNISDFCHITAKLIENRVNSRPIFIQMNTVKIQSFLRSKKNLKSSDILCDELTASVLLKHFCSAVVCKGYCQALNKVGDNFLSHTDLHA